MEDLLIFINYIFILELNFYFYLIFYLDSNNLFINN